MGFTKAIEVEAMCESETGIVVGSRLSIETSPCDGCPHSVKDDACDSVRSLKRKAPEISSNFVDVCDRIDRRKRTIQRDSNNCHQRFDATQFPSAEMENRFGCSRNSWSSGMSDAAADYKPLCDDTQSSSGYIALSDNAHSNASTFASLTACGDSIRPHYCGGSWRFFNDVDNLMELMLDDSWRCFNIVDDLMELLMIDDGVACSRIYPPEDNYVALSDLVVAELLQTENDEREPYNADYIPLPADTQISHTHTTLPYEDNHERLDLIIVPDDTLSTCSSVASCDPCSRTNEDFQDSLWEFLKYDADEDCSDAESCCGN